MQIEFHDDDPRTIWQNQSTEASKMSLVLIRQKARQLQTQTRRQKLGSLTGPFIVAFFYGSCTKLFPQLWPLLHCLFAVALAWSLAGLYFLIRGKWPGTLPADAGFSTGLEFCRREIEQQREYSQHVLLCSFAPIVMVLGTFLLTLAVLAGKRLFMNAMPVVILATIWIIVYLALWIRQRRELGRDIDDLSGVEKENTW